MAAKTKTDLKPARGMVARCAQGRLGLILDGPKPLIVAGERVELWSGIHLTDGKSWQIGGHWVSYRPTVLGSLEELVG